jgi:hypothetical protein
MDRGRRPIDDRDPPSLTWPRDSDASSAKSLCRGTPCRALTRMVRVTVACAARAPPVRHESDCPTRRHWQPGRAASLCRRLAGGELDSWRRTVTVARASVTVRRDCRLEGRSIEVTYESPA